MIKPYDLGNYYLADYSQKISVDDLVREAKRKLKLELVQSQVETLGIPVKFTTSKTRFNGERLWFVCPFCERRIHTLYQHPLQRVVGCRGCLGLVYNKQRFKGMVELRVV